MPLSEELFKPLQYLKGVGPRRSAALEKFGLRTPWDVLHFLPKRHYDRGSVRAVGDARPGQRETLQGVVLAVREERTRGGRLKVAVRLSDGTGEIDAVWWGRAYMGSAFQPGDVVIVTGRVDEFRGLQITPDEFEVAEGDGQAPLHAAGMVPAYGPMEGIGRKPFRRLVRAVVDAFAALVPEYLPAATVARRELLPEAAALRAIHFPGDAGEAERARQRLAYDEFFFLQLALARRRAGLESRRAGVRLKIPPKLDFRIRALFPFRLTRAQDRAIGEIAADLQRARPMNRLLQGDVGSGKTLVAAYAALAAVGNHAQAAVMAPTEILAEQHHRTFRRLLAKSRVRIAFLAGGRRSKARRETIAAIAGGKADLVIGTHALVEKDVEFARLALAIVDEQQKFGVLQRAELRRKGREPHVLVMTATPIPRTLGLTLYGDLDVSVIDEMPPGRQPVHTRFVPDERRGDALRFVRMRLREGRQAYFVYPLVEDSDALPLKSATAMHAELAREFPEHPAALLHGRMDAADKDRVMEDFRAGRVRILVSTLVVEVGIDVPNATVMVIGDCERYGLSTLHQLRGRIGRGAHEGHCLLFGRPASPEARERIRAFTSTADGFKIAESDLRLRGPGEFFGTRQSGLPELRAANLLEDLKLLGWAREDAFTIWPRAGEALKERMARQFAGRIAVSTVG